MAARSPLVGYNHNMRHLDRLWHVQTEDFGVRNPLVISQLFFQGMIFGSKQFRYDPQAAAAEVQKQMQAQHKHLLQELRDGALDEKIRAHFAPTAAASAAPAPAEVVPPTLEKEAEPFQREKTVRRVVPADLRHATAVPRKCPLDLAVASAEGVVLARPLRRPSDSHLRALVPPDYTIDAAILAYLAER